ncbi:P-loop containing nucleoside triphosphate hydrolase protein [Zychaea mexicana]|uniref:P-loop containing nucleoside triphosphate hydrolase protein n=1 Tax=Zychaea mexicana TaxID=64656 RepID=UPI0022FE4B53|nr:P-loop containing nucleoside triphosphate hydrolase protein [Zychaea mexicana]KAI9495855.1 P-loop containing nucleoside triphosphate hydrolase protein [Zychaea mexicana]
MTLKDSIRHQSSHITNSTMEKDEAARLASALMDVKLTEPDITKNQQHNALFDPVNRIDSDEFTDTTRTLKEKLIHATSDDIQALEHLMSTRLDEGRGETLFEIGVEDDGEKMTLTDDEYQQALITVGKIVEKLDADFSTVEERGKHNQQQQGILATLMIRRRLKTVEDLLEIRIAVVGNVDAGKSTLLGVLTKGILDDGRGKARVNLFRHKHEIESGRTSSVGGEILGFDSKSQPVMHPAGTGRKLTWEEICTKATKVLSFVDLAGHEKYLKTTVFGMTGSAPEFVMLMVGANAGMIGMTKEHLGIALSLGIPVLVVVTKIDRCPPNILQNTIKELGTILKSKSCRKIPLFVETDTDVVMTAQNFVSERLCPIFQISNVTGQGLDLLRNFLNILPAQTKYDMEQPFHYEINETYSVPFVGTVVSGIMMSGVIHVGDKVLIGPDHSGNFNMTTIKGIHRKRVTVPAARAGQSVTFALKNVRRSAIRKGMVLLRYDKDHPPPKCSKRFEAEVLVLYHSTTIKQKYQAMVHCGAVRQTASIVSMEKQLLRTGDRAMVQFEFVKTPEYLTIGSRMIFREGRTKGIGKVTRLLE